MWSLLTFWRMAFQSLCVFVGLLYKSDGLYFVTWLSHPVITVNREPGFLLLLDVMLFNPNRVLSFCPSPGYSRRRPSMFGSWPSQDGEFYPFLPVHLWDLLFVADTLLNLPYHCVWMLREPLPLPEGSLVALAKKPAVLWPPSPSDKEEQSVCSLEGRGALMRKGRGMVPGVPPGKSDVAPDLGPLCPGEVWGEITVQMPGKWGEGGKRQTPCLRKAIQLPVGMSCSPWLWGGRAHLSCADGHGRGECKGHGIFFLIYISFIFLFDCAGS